MFKLYLQYLHTRCPFLAWVAHVGTVVGLVMVFSGKANGYTAVSLLCFAGFYAGHYYEAVAD